MDTTTTRRGFLTAGAGLVLALTLPVGRGRAQTVAAAGAGAAPFAPNAFVRIGTDDLVTVMIKHLEMGQGSYTGLSTLVAEELEASWSQMRAEGAPANDELYANTYLGTQLTGGSTGLGNSYIQMRKAGATAREMLVAAAAAEWGVPASEITVKEGVIAHAASGKSSGFGALADAAAKQAVPSDPAIKDPKDFKLIGTMLPRLDSAAKSNGSAEFTMDVYRDGMQTVVVAHPPKFGATVASYDDSAALAVKGVVMVRQISFGVAVYATNTFAALQGRNALKVVWDDSKAETRSTQQIFEEYSTAAATAPTEGFVVETDGDIGAIDGAAKVIEAEYRLPFLAHAPLEPLDAVIELKGNKVEMWYGSQTPGFDRIKAAEVMGIPLDDVHINVLFAGGSFGRRSPGSSHITAEACEIAKAAGQDGVYKLLWTREDDIKGGYYRPMAVHKMRAGLDADGKIVGWDNSVATPSLFTGTPLEGGMVKDGIDGGAFEGSAELPYAFGARRVSWKSMPKTVPVMWWRAVGHSHTGYAVECFLDELFAESGTDPMQGRIDLLKPEETRVRGVLEKVKEISNWSGAVRDGKGYGVAYAKSFGTYVAEVAEVENRDGHPFVTRVWCAVDCGVPVSPDVINAQMEGSIGFGLSAALYSQITLKEGGEVEQANFYNYPLLRISEMPTVEVAIIPSTADPTGVGEPGVSPIAPAVGNAWRALTGQKRYQLPFSLGEKA